MPVEAAPPPPPTAPPVDPRPPRPPSPWPGRLRAAAYWAYGVWCRPRVRLVLIGAVLLLLGGFVLTSSVWTLPLLIIGIAMILIAWIGSRLDGRFAVEWGETGTQLEFRAKIKAAQLPPPARSLSAGSAPVEAERDEDPPDAEVIEGKADTIEIDVDELKALIAAAEAEERAKRAVA